jgi:hypothetical protein
MAARHGTYTRYKGSKSLPPCHCDDCKAANAAYKRDLRTRSPHERTGTRKVRSSSSGQCPVGPTNVVAMPSSRMTQPAAPEHYRPGVVEQSVIDRLAKLEIDDEALKETYRVVARVMDDPDSRALHISAAKQLDTMMTRTGAPRKIKGKSRLAAVQAMSGRDAITRAAFDAGRQSAETGT